MENMQSSRKFVLFVFALLCCTASAFAQKPAVVQPPRLINRAAIVAEQTKMAAKLVKPGDTIVVKAFVRIDEKGRVRAPEIKQTFKDPRVAKYAAALVGAMQFKPATQNGKPKSVLLTIPVRFAR